MFSNRIFRSLLKALGSAGAFALALSVPEALASSAAQQGRQASVTVAPGLEWAGKDTQSCGFSCTYLRANENLSLQASYILRRLDALDQKLGWSPNSSVSSPPAAPPAAVESEVRQEVSEYCTGTSEAIFSCYQRFRKHQLTVLKEVRTAIAANAAEAVRMKSDGKAGQGGISTEVGVEQLSGSSPVAKRAQVTSVATLKEMQEYYDSNPTLNTVTSDQYKDWAQTLAKEPSRDEFAMFKVIPRDSRFPNGEKIQVALRNVDGTLKINEAAYQAALKGFKGNEKALTATAKQMTQGNGFVRKPTMKFVDKGAAKGVSTNISRQAFLGARLDVIDAAHAAMLQVGISGAPTRSMLNPGTPLKGVPKPPGPNTASGTTGVARSPSSPSGGRANPGGAVPQGGQAATVTGRGTVQTNTSAPASAPRTFDEKKDDLAIHDPGPTRGRFETTVILEPTALHAEVEAAEGKKIQLLDTSP